MQQNPFKIVITHQPLCLDDALAFAADPAFGAINSFIGIVRNNNEGRAAEAVTYDVHTTLAEKAITSICQTALEKYHTAAKIYVAHTQGKLIVGQASVVIAVGTPHRKASFEICEYVIDRLKEQAPIWKNEHYIEGDNAWLAGTPLQAAK